MTAQRVVFGRRHLKDVASLEEDLTGDPGRGGQQPHDGHRADGLTAAGLPHQAHGLARTHGEGDAIDDVDLTVLLGEGDREVLDLQNRILAGVLVDQAVPPGKLGHPQGAEPLGQGNVLCRRGDNAGQRAQPVVGVVPVGDGGVGDHRLGGVVPGVQGLLSLHGLLIGLNIGLGLDARRGHRIGQSLGQDVEAQGGDEDEQAGEEGRPPVAR